ncbi:uncharacterized protein ARMOST_21028 [Armillaria ostoyae]|uniref:Uncharacterized protein n=1 Tax=Armillaria ostoyae TaxID=47428 RepID=A0A284S925_ARMOS|nr:uncharacterized protein ARMOST_21028 [Armillaria ostoyae]
MSSDAPVPIADTPSLGMTMGTVFFGLMITAMLHGISVPQLVIYYRRYSKDPRLFRYSVCADTAHSPFSLIRFCTQIGLFWFLDTVQLGLSINALYFYLVSSHGNYQALLQFNWQAMSIRSQYTISMAVIVGVQA